MTSWALAAVVFALAGAADYVPEPRPVGTSVEVCAYYFPGWPSDAKWAPVREKTPERRPLLGWYDESNPECVDWQIKWAVENGITCFLVDWYWSDGSQALTHWLDAYRRARYRDRLKVALMWANHNAPGTHSAADWDAVTRHWIDRYFNLAGYYRVDGQPAVFLWAPENVRRDLGGTEAVRAALAASQELARAAGYPGIAFVALQDHDTPEKAARLCAEGYYTATTYHEWAKAADTAPAPNRWRYADVVESSPRVWAWREATVAPLPYWPVVDTGWDARPWEGDAARVITGRTPELFEHLLRDARRYCEARGLKRVILAPVNEWGEGSYIEPCAEFGFAMYEAIRRVFATAPPDTWPPNRSPADLHLGPYDYSPGLISSGTE